MPDYRRSVHAYLGKSSVSQQYENAINSIMGAMQGYSNLDPVLLRRHSKKLLLMNPADVATCLSKISITNSNCQTKIGEIVRDFKGILLSHVYPYLYNKKDLKDREAAKALGVQRARIVQARIKLSYVPVRKKKGGRRSYDTSAKGIIRNRWDDFIVENLDRPMHEVKVVCLPSLEANLELTGYDRIGIIRSNITGVEKLRRIYKVWKYMGLGIKQVRGDVEDLLRKTQQRFDAVSLDFEGYFRPKYLRCITTVFERDALEDKGVLLLTYLAGREKTPSKTLMREESLGKIMEDILFENERIDSKDLVERYEEVRKGEVIPREAIDYTLAEEGYMAKFRQKLMELGYSLTQNGMMQALELHEDSLLDAIVDGYLLQNARRIWYKSGKSPMRVVFMYFEKGIKRYGNFLVARKELQGHIRKVMPSEIETLMVDGEFRKVLGSPTQWAPGEKQRAKELIKQGVPYETIALALNKSDGQIRAIKSWMTMRGEK